SSLKNPPANAGGTDFMSPTRAVSRLDLVARVLKMNQHHYRHRYLRKAFESTLSGIPSRTRTRLPRMSMTTLPSEVRHEYEFRVSGFEFRVDESAESSWAASG